MESLRALLRSGVEERIFSGAQVALLGPDSPAQVLVEGYTAWPEHASAPVTPITEQTLFDLASVSKMVATAPLLWYALGRGLLRPETPVARFLPDWSAGAQAGVTVRQLWSHSSGLPAWVHLYRDALEPGVQGAPARMREALLASRLEAPPGTRACYSDLGYLLLGVLLERALGGRLDELAHELVFAPLGMRGCRFVRHLEGQALQGPVAETEQTWTHHHGGHPRGQVHDENAWAWGGVAGHAGLFGHAGDLLRFAQALLDSDQGPPPAWPIPSAVVRWALSEQAAGRDHQGLRLGSHLGGVDTPSGEDSTAGPAVTRAPVGATAGHLGFTGTSLWVDRAQRSAVVLLTNRVHPSREPEGMRDFRVRFHEAAFSRLRGQQARRLWPAAPWLAGGPQGAPQILLADQGRRELEVARHAALEAGALARSFAQRGAGFRVQHKGEVDLVTEADLACEAAIVERLQAAFPDYGVLAEEGGAQDSGASHRWIIDPIDGTTNFSHGVPHYCICIALEAHGQLQLGVIYDPSRDELFYASRGAGAWCNGRRLRVTQAPDLQRSLTVTGFPYDRQVVEDNNVPHLAQMIRHVQGMRRFGAAGLDLAWVAAGRLDVYWELRLKPWDMAAGLVLVEEAGGRLTAPDGGPLSMQRGDILATCGGLAHQEAVAVLRRSMGLAPQS